MWFCTDGNGIVRYVNGRAETLKAENGLPDGHNFFVKAIEDREGSLWFVGDGGLLRLTDNKFIVFGRNEGFLTNFGSTVCEDRNGNMWAGLRQGGLVKFDRHTTQVWTEVNGLLAKDVLSVFPSRNGGLWIGTTWGLNYLKNGKLLKAPTVESFEFLDIRALSENNRGQLWVGTFYGYMTKLENNQKNTLRLATGESGSIICVTQRTNGEIWAGTWKKGLYRIVDGIVHHLSEADGFIVDGVNALYEDNEQVMWIATDGHGLYRYKMGKFVNINTNHGLSFDRLFSILEDDRHYLWFSGNRGIFRTSKQQLNDCADGKIKTITCQYFNYLDGMRETECNGRRQPVAWKSHDDRLWFVSTAGVVCVDPKNMPKNEVTPPVYIEEITANKQRTIPADSDVIPLSAHERELNIRYTALSLAIPERVYFKYKLEGYDRDWVDAGTRRTAFYTNLPKGDYTFRVIACNNDSKWNNDGAIVRLSIAPFWWETWWAYLLYALALGLVLHGLRSYEMKRLRLRNELKLQQVRSERLEELDHLKSRFFAGISHEFRTPLTLIGGPLQEMLDNKRDGQQQSKITMMLRNTRRLERLVDELLDLTQLESGKMALQARPVKVVHFLRGIVAAFESYAKQKTIKLDFRAEDQLESEIVFIDPDKMEKVIVNLLANALKYTPSGGNVEVAIATNKGFIEIRVRDTGIGIPEKALPHIFDYFYRYRDKNTSRESGTGIGLALTKELVTLHHGEISAKSNEGVGSEFVICLPLGMAHLRPEEIVSENLEEIDNRVLELVKMAAIGDNKSAVQTMRPLPKGGAASALPMVLLIEDNPDMRSYLREHLHRDYSLLEATNGEKGLQQAQATIPDLIISDVMMPKMDGFELCRSLKSHELTSHIPIILLTARGSGESKLEGLELGADEYLTKPLNARELQLRVRNLLGQQRKLRERFRKEIAVLDVKLSSLPVTSADERFLKRATEIIEKHLSDPDFGPRIFAREMAMSLAHLNRKLRGLLGQRTVDFIRAIRLKYAAELLRQKSGNVSEIAYQVGFNHLSYFARCFKAQYGQLPSEYIPQ